MKPPRSLLLLALGGLAGCVTPPVPEPTTEIRPAPVRATPVRAEQVTPQNAQKMAQALADELDREAQGDLAGNIRPKQ